MIANFHKLHIARVVLLEFRKQRRTFVGIVLTLLLGAGLIAAAALVLEHFDQNDLRTAYQEAILGIFPLCTILLACSAGTSLFRFKDAEEVLPAHPLARFAGSYTVSLIFLAALGIALSLLADPYYRISSLDWVPPAPLLFLFLELHLLAFVLTYWLRQPVIAAGISFFTVGLHGIVLWTIRVVSENLLSLLPMAERMSGPFDGMTLGIMCPETIKVPLSLLLSCVLIGVPVIVRSMETGRRLSKGLSVLVFAGLLSGIVASAIRLGYLAGEIDSGANRLFPLDYDCEFCTRWAWGGENHLGIREPLSSGMILSTAAGKLVRVYKDGRAEILRQAKFTLTADVLWGAITREWFLYPSGENSTYDYFMQDDGTFWELTESALSRSIPGQPMSLYKVQPQGASFLGEVDGAVYAFGSFSYNDAHFQRLDADRPAGIWTGPDMRSVLTELRDRLNLSTCGPDAYSLTAPNGMKWHLPGRCVPWEYEFFPLFPPISEVSPSCYVIPVTGESHRVTFAICRPDGSVTQPWPVSWKPDFRREAVPGGGVAFATDVSSAKPMLLLIARDGITYPPLILNSEWKQTSVRRLDSGKVWLIVNEKDLIRIDASSGATESISNLCGKDSKDCRIYQISTFEGIYFVRNHSVFLCSWEGRIQDLRISTE